MLPKLTERYGLPVRHAASGLSANGSTWIRALRIALSIWLVTRLVFLVAALIIVNVREPITGRVPVTWAWPFRVYANYDSAHFIRIAQYGYLSRGLGDGNVAFFPGYPLLGRYLSTVVGIGHATDGERFAVFAIVAWLGAAVAAVLLWHWVEGIAGDRAATLSVIALLAGPYSLFLMASYSEGPFLALALGAWLCARSRRWPLAGALAAAATLVRVNGVFLWCALLFMYVVESRRDGARLLRWRAVTLPLPILSLAGYFAWLRLAAPGCAWPPGTGTRGSARRGAGGNAPPLGRGVL